jgi:outer membrane murein-binding lipoprotein Lpp
VTPFSSDQWIIVVLIFLLGAVIGMMVMAGGKWKRRYKDERRRAEELEVENQRLRKEADEMASLRHAAARDEARHRTDERRDPDGAGPL